MIALIIVSASVAVLLVAGLLRRLIRLIGGSR